MHDCYKIHSIKAARQLELNPSKIKAKVKSINRNLVHSGYYYNIIYSTLIYYSIPLFYI